MLEGLPIYDFGAREAQRHAELWAHLQRAGTPIGPHDMLIAATALARGHDLLTLNRAEFARVPGLRLVAVHEWPDAEC
jgi:predicted nucleic acid-binding protein